MPHNPNFSSGPCSKRPGWNLAGLKDAALGRSHRSALGKAKLGEAIARSKKLLGVPDDYLLGIMPGSDTGAFEAAMWTMLGPRPVTVLVWESFSGEWAKDVQKELKLKPTVLEAPYGKLPDLKAVDWKSDVVFVANGTTSGVKIPDWDWIPADREGLSMCDATSAVFAMPVEWSKVDVLTYSWQKCLGGEAGQILLCLARGAHQPLDTRSGILNALLGGAARRLCGSGLALKRGQRDFRLDAGFCRGSNGPLSTRQGSLAGGDLVLQCGLFLDQPRLGGVGIRENLFCCLDIADRLRAPRLDVLEPRFREPDFGIERLTRDKQGLHLGGMLGGIFPQALKIVLGDGTLALGLALMAHRGGNRAHGKIVIALGLLAIPARLFIAGGEQQQFKIANFGRERLVFLALPRLFLEVADLPIKLAENVFGAEKIVLRLLEPQFRLVAAGMEARDSGSIFKNTATMLRLGGDDLADLPLPDEARRTRAARGIRKEKLDVAGAHLAPVHPVGGALFADDFPGNIDLFRAGKMAGEVIRRSRNADRNFGMAALGPRGRAAENDVIHAAAAQGFRLYHRRRGFGRLRSRQSPL